MKELSELEESELTELVAKHSSGDRTELLSDLEQIFEELFRRYHQLVFNCVYKMLRDKLEAEDATQEVFFRVSKSLVKGQGKFKGQSSVKTWLYAIALNVARTAYRKKMRKSAEQLMEEIIPELPTHVESNTDVDVLLNCLSPEQRATVILWAEEDLSHAEIAKIMGVPVPTVTWRIFQAKKQMRKFFKKSESELSDGR